MNDEASIFGVTLECKKDFIAQSHVYNLNKFLNKIDSNAFIVKHCLEIQMT